MSLRQNLTALTLATSIGVLSADCTSKTEQARKARQEESCLNGKKILAANGVDTSRYDCDDLTDMTMITLFSVEYLKIEMENLSSSYKICDSAASVALARGDTATTNKIWRIYDENVAKKRAKYPFIFEDSTNRQR